MKEEQRRIEEANMKAEKLKKKKALEAAMARGPNLG